jgi:hypothetical protein
MFLITNPKQRAFPFLPGLILDLFLYTWLSKNLYYISMMTKAVQIKNKQIFNGGISVSDVDLVVFFL